MYPVPSTCPVCTHQLNVTKLHCPQCATALEGQFSLGPLHKLTTDQLQFVEIFLICEGKINRVEQELGMSYPAVRSRLQEVIETLNKNSMPMPSLPPLAAVPPLPPAPARLSDDRRREILAKVSAGEISAPEAAALLRQSN